MASIRTALAIPVSNSWVNVMYVMLPAERLKARRPLYLEGRYNTLRFVRARWDSWETYRIRRELRDWREMPRVGWYRAYRRQFPGQPEWLPKRNQRFTAKADPR